MKNAISNKMITPRMSERAFIFVMSRFRPLDEPLLKNGDGPLKVASVEMSRGNYKKAGPAFGEAISRLRECGKHLRADILFNYAVAKLTRRAEKHAKNKEIIPAFGAVLETVALLENNGKINARAFSDIRRNIEGIIKGAKTGL